MRHYEQLLEIFQNICLISCTVRQNPSVCSKIQVGKKTYKSVQLNFNAKIDYFWWEKDSNI